MDITILGFERLRLCLKKGVFIELEIYEVPEGFKSIAFINDIEYEDIEGYGLHIYKDKSVALAVRHLMKLIRRYGNTL
jgi:hypothetical protein